MENDFQSLLVQICDLEYSIEIPNMIKLEDNDYVEHVNDNIRLKRTFIDAQVNNVWRYNIQVVNGKVSVIEHDQSQVPNSMYKDKLISETQDMNSILLVLESPHKDEIKLENNVLQPKAPAQGTTGSQLKKKLARVLEYNMSLLNLNGEYRFYIVNPIRMQTSLFALHGKSLKEKEYAALRDEIWRLMWSHHPDFKNGFKKLLGDVNPCIVLNACTANLKKEVNSEMPKNISLFEVYHPSSWVYRKAENIMIEELKWSNGNKTYVKSATAIKLNAAV